MRCEQDMANREDCTEPEADEDDCSCRTVSRLRVLGVQDDYRRA